MAFALVAQGQSKGTTPSTAQDISAAKLLIGVQSYSTGAPATPSDGVETWIPLTAAENLFTIASRLWYVLNPTPDASYQVQAGASCTFAYLAFSADGTILFDDEADNEISTNASSFVDQEVFTPNQNDSLMISAAAGAGGSLTTWISVNGGYSIDEVTDSSGGSTVAAAIGFLLQGTAAATSPRWTSDATGTCFCNAHGASFYESGGGGFDPATLPHVAQPALLPPKRDVVSYRRRLSGLFVPSYPHYALG